eukprot:TRINITY_DN1336_c1_g1_i1.p2 TRINITY_DN1336_c1_g1~~TRINITY_DN1336_c1_g1_i1.p2  ORF type:complete len:105 (-),score=53.42 TRINITY_DN1336_c1_g1_i1:77-391(-)
MTDKIGILFGVFKREDSGWFTFYIVNKPMRSRTIMECTCPIRDILQEMFGPPPQPQQLQPPKQPQQQPQQPQQPPKQQQQQPQHHQQTPPPQQPSHLPPLPPRD